MVTKISEKRPVTILLTKKQFEKIKQESRETGNSLNSIIRTALEFHFQIER